MKNIATSLLIILFAKFSFGQTEFSNCYDTLYKQLTTNMHPNVNVFSNWENCIKGNPMPVLSIETISGEKIETQKLKGKVLVINIWFTSCHPCITELPALNRLVEEYRGKEVEFIGLCTDTKERLDSDFFPKYKFDFKIVANAGNLFKKIGETGCPTIYIIDKKGNVQAAWVGGFVGPEAETAAYLKAKPIIDELLKPE